VQRIGRFALIVFQISLLSALIVVTRCANYQDVFVAGNIYFIDADCYARMTRVQLVSAKPGLIVRHHVFENFPNGTTPHTTAPLDYLIFALSLLLRPFSSHAVDLAGAFVSPALALIGGWFLWWWSRQMRFRYGWVMLTLYAISPILVQGTQLGRPDHQSLSILLVAIGICAEWMLRTKAQTAASTEYGRWGVASGVSWGLAIWNSAYEPLVIFLLVIGVSALEDPKELLAQRRRIGWSCFVVTIALAALIERRVPPLTTLFPSPIFNNWARTIGELTHTSPANPISALDYAESAKPCRV
jgi:asparagine N-glycosylation enzyme membrane subunit Stt3